MSVDPCNRLKEQLDPEILQMIREYNKRDYEITSRRLCGSNEKYDADLMNKHYPQLNQLYEEERQRLRQDGILSLQNYTETQEIDIFFMEEHLDKKNRGHRIDPDDEEIFADTARREPMLYEEAVRKTELRRDYRFLEKVVKYYRISLLMSSGGGGGGPAE